MAFTNFIPQVWEARLLANWKRHNVWGPLVADLSGRLRGQMVNGVWVGGNTVNLGALSSAPTWRTYTRGTNLVYEDADTAVTQMRLNQEKYFALKVEDIDRSQATPGVIDEYMREAAIEGSLTHNDHIRTQASASLPTARYQTVTGGLNVAGRNDNYRTSLVQNIADVAARTLSESWPRDMGLYMVISPLTYGQLAHYYGSQTNQGTGVIADAIIRQFNLNPLMNFDIVVDAGIPETGVAGVARVIYFGVKGATMAWAQTLDQVETLRDIDSFSDLMRGMSVFEAVRTRDSRAYELRHTAAVA